MAVQNWIRAVITQMNFNALYQNTLDFAVEDTPTIAMLQSLSTGIDTTFMPLMNALQHENCLNVQVFTQWRGNAMIQFTETLSGGGVITGGETSPRPQNSIYIRQVPSLESYEWSDDTQVVPTARRIMRGAFFLGGIGEEWQADGISVIPSGLATDLAALLSFLSTELDPTGYNFVPVVHGYALPAITGDNPKPARNECFSPITNSMFMSSTWLKSRKGVT